MNVKVLTDRTPFHKLSLSLNAGIMMHLYFQVRELKAPPLEEEYIPRFLTVHLTGIGRSRERVLQSGGCALSTRVTPFLQGFCSCFLFWAVRDGRCGRSMSLPPTVGLGS